MNKKVPILSVRYDLGTVLARVRGGGTISKMSTCQIFHNFGQGGEGHQKSVFSPQIQVSPNYPGGGQENYELFSTICDIFCFDGSP